MRRSQLKEKLLLYFTKSKIGLRVLNLLGYRVKNEEVTVVVLVGVPGSGKSTLAKTLEKKGYIRINQDELGSRGACKRRMQECMKKRQNVVIDRCNFDKWQRSTWVNVAKMYPAVTSVTAVVFDTTIGECINRAKSRKSHPTIDPDKVDVDKIIMEMYNKYREPELSEGFTKIVRCSKDGNIYEEQ